MERRNDRNGESGEVMKIGAIRDKYESGRDAASTAESYRSSPTAKTPRIVLAEFAVG